MGKVFNISSKCPYIEAMRCVIKRTTVFLDTVCT